MFNLFVIYMMNNLYSAIQVDLLRDTNNANKMNIEMNDSILGFYREAIARGYGRWEVSEIAVDTLSVRFAWIDVVDVVDDIGDDIVNRVLSNNVDNVSNVFKISDYELSLSLGMDLESDLKRGILLLLDFHLVNVDESLRIEIKRDILDLIGNRFAGFKTYNRLKDKQ
jgi:hypothetical protein